MRVLVVTGAGISAESGIPTFRGTGGYWRNLDPTKLATQSAFDSDPEIVWQWYRERREMIRRAEPNDAHRAVARLSAAEDATGVPRCPRCSARMRPGVVWFGEGLDPHEVARVDTFVRARPCDVAIVVGTTVAFDYIVHWTRLAAGRRGRLIEVNPDDQFLKPLGAERVKENAASALPRLVDDLLSGSKPR